MCESFSILMDGLMKKKSLLALMTPFALFFLHCFVLASPERFLNEPKKSNPVSFPEIWAYLMQGEEKEFRGSEPVTDLCYFSARFNNEGKLFGVKIPPEAVKNNRRIHLVVAELSNSALTRLVLEPALPFRKNLIDDIAAVSKHFSGIQIDFESVTPADRDNFISFLRELKLTLGESLILSVALPPRRGAAGDAYQYGPVSEIADRIIIMAYDQHWSTGPPGPVASLKWCGEIGAFAGSRIPKGKLVMGIPLYGRAWQDTRHNRALRDEHVREIMKKKRPMVHIHPEKGPFMTYQETVTITAYFNTLPSILDRMRLYYTLGARGVAFWRIGQNDPRLWNYVRAETDENDKYPTLINPERKILSDEAISPKKKDEASITQ